jgi:hypothetical protein
MSSGALYERRYVVMLVLASASLIALALAAIISNLETWPEQLPSMEETRRELGHRLTTRLRRLTRAAGWMTVGLTGVLSTAPMVLRFPIMLSLVSLGWSLFDAPRPGSGADPNWLGRVRLSARLARSLTMIVGAALLIVALFDRSYVIAPAILLLAAAHAHSIVAGAAEEVLELVTHAPSGS